MTAVDPWAVSTLGAPTASLTEFTALSRRFGFRGLEVRIEPGGPVEPGTDRAALDRVRSELADAGIAVVAATSRHRLCAPDLDVVAVRSDLAVAAGLAAPGLRVFMGGEGDRAADEGRAVAAVVALADACTDAGVDLLLETHDSHPTGRDLAGFLARLDRELPGHPCRIVWDTAHSWSAGEAFADSFSAVAPRLAHVQVKDVVAEGDRPSVLGAGGFPLGTLVDVLRDAAWHGWVSLEYERAWHPSLPPLEEALESFVAWVDREVREPR